MTRSAPRASGMKPQRTRAPRHSVQRLVGCGHRSSIVNYGAARIRDVECCKKLLIGIRKRKNDPVFWVARPTATGRHAHWLNYKLSASPLRDRNLLKLSERSRLAFAYGRWRRKLRRVWWHDLSRIR